jgi:hypothetical protein
VNYIGVATTLMGDDLNRVHYWLRLVKQALLDPTGFEFSALICELRWNIFGNSEYCVLLADNWVGLHLNTSK